MFPSMPIPTASHIMSSEEGAEEGAEPTYDPQVLAAAVAAHVSKLNAEQITDHRTFNNILGTFAWEHLLPRQLPILEDQRCTQLLLQMT